VTDPRHDSSAADIEPYDGDPLLEFESAPMPMLLIRPDGRLLMANGALRQLLGFATDELVGQSVTTVLAPESMAVIAARLRTALECTFPLPEITTILRARDGRRVTVRSSSASVRDDDGAPLSIMVRLLPVDG
jgi:PAS domain S-box-containing protein